MHIAAVEDTTAQRPWQQQFTFVGWHGGWYVLLLRAEGHAPLEVQAFRKRVLEWLIEQSITPNIWSDLANGNTGNAGGPETDRLWLLFRRAPDVLRFERRFGARGVTPDAMFKALRAEASAWTDGVRHRRLLATLDCAGAKQPNAVS
jgi:hypothetical protein